MRARERASEEVMSTMNQSHENLREKCSREEGTASIKALSWKTTWHIQRAKNGSGRLEGSE